MSELPGVNKKTDKPINRTPVEPKNITHLFESERCLNACKAAPEIRQTPIERMIK
ncbi:hypothetical protein [Oceanobacillus profundus]|uniref:hypothetical protein n=1 Tax=Oceanobacillus profundus TaxID=372463 RepID=UPI003633956D